MSLACYTSTSKQSDCSLSFKAGLRACEITGLTWSMVLRSDGKVADHLTIAGNIAKYGSGRLIPMHSDLKAAVRAFDKFARRPATGPVVVSERGGHMTAGSIVNWFHSTYGNLALEGCSSHSGRRTFITQAARVIGKSGGSLRDI